MRVFVIGATGFIGSHVAARLLAGGHNVVGLARSAEGANFVRTLGATAHIGDLSDPSALTAAALEADATVFAPQLPSQDAEFACVDLLLNAYRQTGKTFLFTSGTGVLGQRTMGEWSEDAFAEDDDFIPSKYILRRRQTELRTRAAEQDGVRAMVVRPPVVWGAGRHTIVRSVLRSIDRTGKACYIGRGLNLYTHVQVQDLAELYLAALERGAAGALYHAAAGELNNRTLAEYVARQQGVETHSVTQSEAFEIWDKFTVLVVLGVSSRTRSPRSRRELGWSPANVDVAQAILDGRLTDSR